MTDKIEIDRSDLLKIYDALDGATRFNMLRDKMNAELHKSEEVRYSPLTSTLIAEHIRLHHILGLKSEETW